MTYHYLAFFMGLLGSIHCAVMCGPLLIAVQGGSAVSWKTTFNKLLYQFGRILTYGLLGVLLGLIGNAAAVQGWQQAFSLVTGIVLTALGLFYMLGKHSKQLASFQSKAIQPFARFMGQWLYRPGGSFVAGVLNGVLPCGMVYMALASAVNASSLQNSFMFMVLFGLGTLPLLLIFSFVGNFPKRVLKKGFSSILPVLFILMGVWFILRGANLDIPYLSPLLHMEGAMNCA
ncbi:sulfite exporter TauE/SafE family protein [Sphingobacterium sp. DK4209]|uniref:Sulfite exporter TauE/SafE family protein n=1 Tax=Sphingobacterium zhuxiongii TaxID=2662364 RepID=A0A5Q0QCZ5_9SPHI|nr:MULTISPECIES: sulfite exporter TauE/SafE family protein [unclassified Sphingobacterium]MVZ67530.1 sulfite exporter TauE/SafE family protein [Sphingobacterium sp. DK4209]QGA27184.1 sulfite exporter TauE/SafE family protein [Sphingobacterium sp. dk4302]